MGGELHHLTKRLSLYHNRLKTMDEDGKGPLCMMLTEFSHQVPWHPVPADLARSVVFIEEWSSTQELLEVQYEIQ